MKLENPKRWWLRDRLWNDLCAPPRSDLVYQLMYQLDNPLSGQLWTWLRYHLRDDLLEELP